jgi:hypothetical protein
MEVKRSLKVVGGVSGSGFFIKEDGGDVREERG